MEEKDFYNHIKGDLDIRSEENKINEIKKYIQDRVIEKSNKNINSYCFSLKVCDKSNKIYPLRYKLSEDSKIIEWTEIEEPKNIDYMILESIEQKKDNIYKKSIHII